MCIRDRSLFPKALPAKFFVFSITSFNQILPDQWLNSSTSYHHWELCLCYCLDYIPGSNGWAYAASQLCQKLYFLHNFLQLVQRYSAWHLSTDRHPRLCWYAICRTGKSASAVCNHLGAGVHIFYRQNCTERIANYRFWNCCVRCAPRPAIRNDN